MQQPEKMVSSLRYNNSNIIHQIITNRVSTYVYVDLIPKLGVVIKISHCTSKASYWPALSITF